MTLSILNKGDGLTASRNLHWTTNRFGDRFIEEINFETFNKLGAKLTIDGAFRNTFDDIDTFYIIAGSDSGYLIRHVQDMQAPTGTRYLFVEPINVYDALSDEGILSNLPPHIRVTSAERWIQEAEQLRLTDYLSIDGVKVVFSLAAQSGTDDETTAIAWKLQDSLTYLRHKVAASVVTEPFISCQLQNAPDNLVSASAWIDLLKGGVGVVMAGGPSLDQTLPWIKANRNALVLLAVSRISDRLADVGIEPDFVLSVDPQDISYWVSRGMYRFSERTIFINQYHVSPRLLSQWPHRSFYLGTLFPWKSELNPPTPLNGVGPTVTNSAVQFAGALGLKTILLAGVDLCFTPEGYTHAEGSGERKAGPRFDLPGLEVETYEGRKASTVEAYAMAAENLDLQAKALGERGVRVFNLSSNAVRLEHVPYMDPARLTFPEQPKPDLASLAVAGDAFNEPGRLRHVDWILKELNTRLGELTELERSLKRAYKLATRVITDEGFVSSTKLRHRLETLERNINERHPELAELIRRFSIRPLLRSLRLTRSAEEMGAHDLREALTEYYQAHLDGARRLRSQLELAIAKAKSRRDEYSGKRSLETLADEWLKRGEAGRVVRWMKLHPFNDLRSESNITSKVEQLLTTFKEDLQRAGDLHYARVRVHSNPKFARIRIEQLFARGDIGALAAIVTGLEEMHENESFKGVLELGRGLLAELKGDLNVAFKCYEEALKSEDRQIWKTALVRIASQALQQKELRIAEQALQCLSDLQDRYCIQYGDFLAATGRVGEALQVYERYFSRHPQDLDAMVRLARMMANAGAIDSARAMIEHIQKQPKGQEIASAALKLIDHP